MSRKNSSLMHEEQCTFEESMHLYAMNNSVVFHNKKMLKKLNIPVVLCSAEQQRQKTSTTTEDEHFPAKVLLCNEQKVMLNSNLWVHAGLVNGTLGKVTAIFYSIGSKPQNYHPSWLSTLGNTKEHHGTFHAQHMYPFLPSQGVHAVKYHFKWHGL